MVNIKNEILKRRNLPVRFFNPTIQDKGDAAKLHNIGRAKDLFLSYVKDKEKKITVVADPDIDGIMASTIMYQWIKNIHNGVKISHHQRNKGHGVIPERINKTDLLIIVDSSSNSIEEVKLILQQGKAADIIILDHHETDGKINEIPNVVLVNPHQPLDKYRNKHLSGGLLTFKFLEYCEGYIDNAMSHQLIDLAAISIVSDVMNVAEMENRYYYYEGTRLIKNKGLATLLYKLNIDCSNINSTDLAFKLNKALNSTLRLQNIILIFKLILYYQSDEDISFVQQIIENIQKRENIENEIISSISILHDSKGVILAQNNYSEANSMSNNFNGVIASKMADREGKNVAVVSKGLRGSGRAYADYNFKDYINNSGYATGAGHQGAFGINILDLESLRSYIIDHPPIFEVDDTYDIELKFKDLTKKLFAEVMDLQYLIGSGFDEIKFKIADVIVEDIKQTSGGNTYYVSDKTKKYIRFMDKSPNTKEIKKGNTICVYGTLRINTFFGKEYYECHCYNIKVIDDKIDDSWGF